MSKLRIFIEGRELDTLDNVTVPITKQYEELSNPTVICNDYSKTVTVPLSKNNNDIFGHCYNPDRLISTTGDEDTPIVGIYFDPYKKLDCRLQWGDDVFFTGYAKMLKVTNKGYEVTINGELGKIFQELKKISFQKSDFESDEEIEKYWIDGSQYVDDYINADLVASTWNRIGNNDLNLYTVNDENYSIGNIMTFVLNPYKSSNYQSDKHIAANQPGIIVDNSIWYEKNDENDGAIKEKYKELVSDLAPFQLRQFRSYQQFPVMYFNQFFQIFQKKAESLTGYKWEYDDAFFTNGNPYWSQIAFALRNYEQINKDTQTVSDYKFYIKMLNNYQTGYYGLIYESDGTLANETTTATTATYIPINTDFNFFKLSLSDGGIELRSYNSSSSDLNRSTLYYGGLDNFGYYELKINDKRKIVWVNQQVLNNHFDTTYFSDCIVIGVEDQSNMKKFIDLVLPYNTSQIPIFQNELKTDDFGKKKFNITINGGWFGDKKYQAPAVGVYDSSSTNIFQSNIYHLDSDVTLAGNNICYKDFFGSYAHVTLNSFLTKGWDFIVDYCKAFNLIISLDEFNKKIIFQTKKTYFKYIELNDMTSKIDISSNYDVEFLKTEYNNFVFGQNDSDNNLSENYNSFYSIPYGSYKFYTGYNFSENSNDVVKYKTPLLRTESCYFIDDLFDNKLTYDRQNVYISAGDSDNKYKSLSEGVFMFVSPGFTDNNGIVLTDDTQYELGEGNVYPYIVDSYNSTSKITIPSSIKRQIKVYGIATHKIGFNSLYYGVPNISYINSDNTDTTFADATIFKTFWKTYINERYNIQNKKVTTYVRLSPSDYINFKFNQFWKIGDQLYIVNKIFDYDITSTKPTKVELITVQNIDAYKS